MYIKGEHNKSSKFKLPLLTVVVFVSVVLVTLWPFLQGDDNNALVSIATSSAVVSLSYMYIHVQCVYGKNYSLPF